MSNEPAPAQGDTPHPGGRPSEVIDDESQGRFELNADGYLAELVYRRVGKRLVLVHTGVPAELEGRGIGGQLVRAAVARAARDELTIVPSCPFARSWLERHPDTAAEVTIDWACRLQACRDMACR